MTVQPSKVSNLYETALDAIECNHKDRMAIGNDIHVMERLGPKIKAVRKSITNLIGEVTVLDCDRNDLLRDGEVKMGITKLLTTLRTWGVQLDEILEPEQAEREPRFPEME